MRAIEFKSKIKNNQISIPASVQSQIITNEAKDVRVIVLLDESDDSVFQNNTQYQFLENFAESDSIYDKP